MKQNDIASEHKEVKKSAYWDNLVGGGTAAYKEQRLDELLRQYRPPIVRSMIDIGCGTCELIFRYQKEFGVQSLTCMDYDSNVIEFLKAKYPSEQVTWLVADVFALGEASKTYDLIFLLDMVHEVYSFYGRTDRNVDQPVDHGLGLTFVAKLLDNVCQATAPGGCVMITDNVLCEENRDIRVKLRNSRVVGAVKFFLENYPTKRMTARFSGDHELVMNSRDFCILLTQYNKIKNEDWDRWNVEKMEIHQYFSLEEYRKAFAQRGLKTYAIVGMPEDAAREWAEDFAVVDGLSGLPEKRITLLARKE